MSRDTWEEVWAEYDVRQAGHAAGPAQSIAPPIEVPLARRASGWGGPQKLALGGMLALLAVLLGLPFGDAGAPAVASQEQTFQRHTMIVAGIAGEAEMGESPAAAPPEADLLAEAVLVPPPPPAWVRASVGMASPAQARLAQVNPLASAEPTAAPEARRAAPTPRRLARRPARQLAIATAAEQAWFDGSVSLQPRRHASRRHAAPEASAPVNPAPAASAPVNPAPVASAPGSTAPLAASLGRQAWPQGGQGTVTGPGRTRAKPPSTAT